MLTALLVVQAEHVRGALPGPAGDQEDRAARRPQGGNDLHVQRDRARHLAGAIERDDDLRSR